jgi:VanZ family protein
VKRLLPWLPAAGWAGLIFFLSSLSTIPLAPPVPHLDKAGHFAVYLVLGALLAHATARTGWPLALAVGLGVVYGMTDEVHQTFVPGRTATVGDWVADAAGVLAGVYLYSRLRARRPLHTDPTGLRA